MWTLSGFADEIDDDLVRQCEVLGELSITNIEFRSAWGTNVLDLTDEQLEAAARILAEHGIAMSSVGSPIGKVGIADDFDAHLARFTRALEVAEFFHAPYIRLFSFFIPAGDDPASHRDDVLRRMSALAAAARPHELTLLHENEKEIYGDVPDRCRDIVESVGAENLKLVWDPANFVQCGVRPFTDGYRTLRPFVDYVQVKDARLADARVVPAGEGDGELRETLAALHADGFDGFFSMEPHLAQAGRYGGSSGADAFGTATKAFTALLDEASIPYC